MFPNMNVARIRTENSKSTPDRVNTWGGFYSDSGNITFGRSEFTRGSKRNYLDVSIRTNEFNNFLINAY